MGLLIDKLCLPVCFNSNLFPTVRSSCGSLARYFFGFCLLSLQTDRLIDWYSASAVALYSAHSAPRLLARSATADPQLRMLRSAKVSTRYPRYACRSTVWNCAYVITQLSRLIPNTHRRRRRDSTVRRRRRWVLDMSRLVFAFVYFFIVFLFLLRVLD